MDGKDNNLFCLRDKVQKVDKKTSNVHSFLKTHNKEHAENV